MTSTRRAAQALAILILTGAVAVPASVIGSNPPTDSITRDRIAQLPVADQPAWLSYLELSERRRQADIQMLKTEMMRAGLNEALEPASDAAAHSIPLDRESSWYGSDEARHVADVIVSFQTPAGGWGKNLEMSKEMRRAGESFTSNNLSRFTAPGDFDAPREPDWNYVGTIDNDATTTQMKFLAKTITAAGARDASAYRAAFLRGMNYLFEAQFPNGGWPQVWPLEGGYHDAITYNDNAMIEVMELMRHVADGAGQYAFVAAQNPRARREELCARGSMDLRHADQNQREALRFGLSSPMP